jgi:CubicO group peptidase (beta-lactamase class C family)
VLANGGITVQWRALVAIVAIACAAAVTVGAVQSKSDPLPVTGDPVPELQAADDCIIAFLREHKVPGAAVAVAKSGRLVYVRGFGMADADRKLPVQPESLFRIASVSKVFTAAAVCRLVEDGRLAFTDKVLDLVKLKPPLNADMDKRWKDITVQHLLDHKGGWDREKSGDPMMRPINIARALGVASPARQEQTITYMLGQPLDFDPGSKAVYSNFGYCLLGRVIEKASGRPYEKYVVETLLKPLGIREMRLGKTLAAARGEVRYYDSQGTMATGAFPAQRLKMAAAPYGPFCLEAMDSHCGWLATAADLVRFGTAFDQPERFPAFHCAAFTTRFDRDYFHTGHLPGSSTILRRGGTDLTWAVLFNSDKTATGKELAVELNHRFQKVLANVADWPKTDLFETLKYDVVPPAK